MAKTKVSEWSTTPSSNTDIDGINIAEGCAPSGINDAIRDMMAQIRSWQSGASADPFNGPMNGPIGATTAYSGAFTTLSASGTTTLSGLTASTALALDASKNVVSVTNTGSGNNVLATSPTLVTPALGTPTSATLTNATGLPISTGVSGLGTGIATALAINTGSAGAPVLFNGALGTPTSGTVTNLTGTASININGTVGATTANSGAFTTLSASSTVSGSGFSTYLASPPAIGGTAAAAGSFTTLSASSTVTLSGGTANGVLHLNGSKVVTSGSALTFNGTTLINTAGGIRVGSNTAGGGSFSAWGGSTGATIDITPNATSGANGVTYNTSFIAGGNGPHIFTIGGSEGMRLTTTGLGVGTTSPSRKLHVYDTGNIPVRIETNTSDTKIEILTTSGTQFIQASANNLLFGTNNTERARIDSSGNLLVGTTASTGDATNAKQLVGGIYSTVSGSVSTATSTATTMFTIPSTVSAWFVTVNVSTASTAYAATYIVNTQGGSATVATQIYKGANISVTMSGYAVQVTQTSGVTQTVTYSAMRIA